MNNTIGTPNTTAAQLTQQRGQIAIDFDAAMQIKRQRVMPRINRICAEINPNLRWREPSETDADSPTQLSQAVGMYALAANRGRLMEGMWPVGENPIGFGLCCGDDDKREQGYSDQDIQDSEKWLEWARHDLWNTVIGTRTNVRAFTSGCGFLAAMSCNTDLGLTHGDSCLHVRDDFLIETFTPDQWVCVRDGQKLVTRVMLCRNIDPMTLDPDTRAKCNLPEGWLSQPTYQRMVYIFTDYAWESGKWRMREECNAQQIFEQYHEEPVIFPCPWEVVGGNQYGTPYFEIGWAKLAELSGLKGAGHDIVNLMRDAKVFLDRGSSIRPRRMVGPSGMIIANANVKDGVVQDVGVVNLQKHADLREIREEARLVEGELAKMFGVELDLLPTQDRTTRLQVQEVVSRLNAMNGGKVMGYFETVTTQVVRALISVAIRTKHWGEPPPNVKRVIDGFWEVSFTTGLTTLARGNNVNKTLGWAQAWTTLKQNGLPENIDEGKLASKLARDMGLDLSHCELTPQQVAAKQQAAINQQVQAQAAIEASKATAPVVAQAAFGAPQAQ